MVKKSFLKVNKKLTTSPKVSIFFSMRNIFSLKEKFYVVKIPHKLHSKIYNLARNLQASSYGYVSASDVIGAAIELYSHNISDPHSSSPSSPTPSPGPSAEDWEKFDRMVDNAAANNWGNVENG